MPENVLEQPVTHRLVKQHTPNIPAIPQDAIKERGGYTNEISWDRIVNVANQAVSRLKTKYPDVPEFKIEATADLLFGPFRIERKALVDDVDSKAAREIRARIQHNLVHGILYGGYKEAGPSYSEAIYSVASFMDKLSNSIPGELTGLKAYWSGVKNETAIIRALLKGGYNVELPDYSQDTTDLPDEDNEVLQWDVNSGIDLIASKSGEDLLLIDAKGRSRFKDGWIRTLVHVNQSPVGYVPKDIIDAHKEHFNEEKVRRLEIVIPADSQFISGLVPLSSNVRPRQALTSFAVSRFEDDIIQRVKHPTRIKK